MVTKLFVGSLPWSVRDKALKEAFQQAGEVVSATVIIDRATDRSKGFGFVEMASEEEAQKAINMWNGQDFEGRDIVVNIARPRERR